MKLHLIEIPGYGEECEFLVLASKKKLRKIPSKVPGYKNARAKIKHIGSAAPNIKKGIVTITPIENANETLPH